MKEVLFDDLAATAGFFSTYKDTWGARFDELFPGASEEDIERMDLSLAATHGERVLARSYAKAFAEDGAEKAMRRIVSVCDIMLFPMWKALQEKIAEADAASAATPYSERRTTRQKQSGSTSSSDTEKNKVYAFDSEEASDESEREGANTSERKDKLDSTVTIERSDGSAVKNVQEYIDFTQDGVFLEMVFDDIMQICALPLTM